MNKPYNFRLNTKENNPVTRSNNLKRILLFGIIFFGFISVFQLIDIVQSTLERRWIQAGVSKYMYSMIFDGSLIFFFMILLRLYWSHRPFHLILGKGIKILGCILTISAFLIPRMPDYSYFGIQFIRFNNFVLADGSFLIIGLIFIIMAYIFEAGFELQNEVDSIL